MSFLPSKRALVIFPLIALCLTGCSKQSKQEKLYRAATNEITRQLSVVVDQFSIGSRMANVSFHNAGNPADKETYKLCLKNAPKNCSDEYKRWGAAGGDTIKIGDNFSPEERAQADKIKKIIEDRQANL